MKKFLMLLSVALLLFLCACSGQPSEQSVDAPVYNGTIEEFCASYNWVEMSMTKAEIEVELGQGVANELNQTVVYTDQEGETGVILVYYEDGTVRGKTLYYQDIRTIGALMPVSKYGMHDKVKPGMKLAEVDQLMGSTGLELMRINELMDDPADYKIYYVYTSPHGIVLECFMTPDMKVIEVLSGFEPEQQEQATE